MGDLKSFLRSDYRSGVRVCVYLRVLHHHVDGVEVLGVLGLQDLDDLYQVGMVELAQDAYLAEDALAVDLIVEDSVEPAWNTLLSAIRLPLDGHLPAGRFLDGFGHATVRT